MALERYEARREAASAAPRIKVEQAKGKPDKLTLDHARQGMGARLFAESFGTADFDFANGILTQLSSFVSRSGTVDEEALNFLLSMIKDFKPRDQFETMLTAKMSVIHMSVMRFARQLAVSKTFKEQESTVNTLTKLTRTYTSQVEALKRYRTGGEQKVTVQHVNVGEGGQAIVGNVTQQPPREPSPSAIAEPLRALPQSAEAPMQLLGENKPGDKNGR